MKIIPAIDLMDGQVVRLYRGDPAQKTVYSNDPIDIAKRWESDGADMLHLVDLDATLGRGSNLGMIKKILDSTVIPVEVAGGLRTRTLAADMAQISERIVLGTLAFTEKPLLQKLLDEFGSSKIVISVDHRDGQITINGWQKDTDIRLLDAMTDFVDMGFTEFLLTNVSRDGTLDGPDLEFLEKSCCISRANVIASGGISGIHDITQVKEKNPFGVILGKALYEDKISIKEAKKAA